MDFAGAAAPAGWLLCNGSAVSRTTYAALFAAISTVYGVGDGSTTFNLPDLGGRVTAGKEATATRLTTAGSGLDGSVLGAAGGAQNENLTLAQLPSGVALFQPSGASFYQFNNAAAVYLGYQSAQAAPILHVQPTIVMNKIIKI
jgi:microcystin-dependent protein